MTDENGKYKISVNQQLKFLLFSFNGYNSVEEKVGEKRVINVILQQTVSMMHEDRAMVRSEMMSSQSAGVTFKSRQNYNVHNPSFNTEGYALINENGYKNVKMNPLSTFSIDVDNASYSNIRRFIKSIFH